MKCYVVMVVLVALGAADVASAKKWFRYRRNTKPEYRMCVPEDLLDYCNQMAREETKATAQIVCIPARDRIECMEKIHERKADFQTVDPEDMYVAGNARDQDFLVFEEIRTKEEPEAEFRYEAVAVIPKDLQLNSIADIKGLNSCHTGVGRNVGYKVPLTKLKKMGVIGPLNEPDLSPRENELKAFSTLFNKACIVGKWSPDPKINSQWKIKYHNLCELCEEPNKCDYPDKFSGYDGALRCLAHNGGQIAWTKVIYVRKFFGLPVGVTPAQSTGENPDNFAYLCPDASRVPITEKPCTWAARPWQGYMANADVIKNANDLRRKIENLESVGSKLHAPWLEKVLELSDKTIPHESKVIGPKDHLDKANYTDVVERDYGPPIKTIRICYSTSAAARKCRDFSNAAFSRNVRPRFDCVAERNVEGCFRTIRDNAADVIAIDAAQVESAKQKFNLRPIVAEKYNSSTDGSYYTVAVVRKSSTFKSLHDLKGAKACFPAYLGVAYYSAVSTLLQNQLIQANECPRVSAVANFFGPSCLPGVLGRSSEEGITTTIKEKVCSICDGGDSPFSRCSEKDDARVGDFGALKCLSSANGGDVAFVRQDAVLEGQIKSEDFELLCPNGGRSPLQNYQSCNFGIAPPNMIVTSNAKGENELDEIRNALLSASSLYSKRPDWFRMFGPYERKNDVLFSDLAVDLVSVNEETDLKREFARKLETVDSCNVNSNSN